MKLTLHGIVGNDTIFAGFASAAFVALHIGAVKTSTIIFPTPLGPSVVGIFPAIAEIFIIVGVCWRLGSLAGVAVVGTSYALGLSLAAPQTVLATTVSKLAVVGVVAPLMPHWRKWHPMALLFGMCGLAMVVEAVAFAVTYGDWRILLPSLYIKALYMVAAGVIFGARRPGQHDGQRTSGGAAPAGGGPGNDVPPVADGPAGDRGPLDLEPVPAGFGPAPGQRRAGPVAQPGRLLFRRVRPHAR